MKLLLDENLSRRLVPFLQSTFPGSSQVALLGLEQVADDRIWNYAKSQNFVIVTCDADFEELSLLRGAPPHVIRLTAGNLSKAAMLAVLVTHADAIRHTIETDRRACVEIAGRRPN